jgi:hypothetical protein
MEWKSAHSRETCTPIFIVVLFVIVKPWNQCRCPTTNEWIKKMWYTHAMEYSAIRKNEMMSFAGKENWRSPCLAT